MKQFVTPGSSTWAAQLREDTGADAMPFVPAVVTRGDTVWLSGATAYPLVHQHPDEEAGQTVPDGIAEQTRTCLENLLIALRAAGGDVQDIVKVTIFNTDMDAQNEVNRVYAEFFGEHKPARSHIGVNRLVSPELKIEIEATAVIG